MTVGTTYDGSVYLCEYIDDRTMRMHDKSTISAGDGVRYETIRGLKYLRNRQALAVAKMLRRHGVMQALKGNSTPNTLYAQRVKMIPVEVVVRGAYIGSWLERNPSYEPHWSEPTVEFFYKKTYDKRVEGFVDGNTLREEGAAEIKRLKAEKIVFPDPYMLHAGDDVWEIHDAHVPRGDALTSLTLECPRAEMEARALEVFTLLSQSFNTLPCNDYELTFDRLHLADIKFEFGIDPKSHKLVLADTVTLDSLRLLMNGKFGKEHQLSKQVFRDDKPLDKVKAIYQLGTMLFEAALA